MEVSKKTQALMDAVEKTTITPKETENLIETEAKAVAMMNNPDYGGVLPSVRQNHQVMNPTLHTSSVLGGLIDRGLEHIKHDNPIEAIATFVIALRIARDIGLVALEVCPADMVVILNGLKDAISLAEEHRREAETPE